MTVLLQTRVPRELALRFKSAAQTKGKSTYQVLRELAADYANKGARRGFVSEGYPDRFDLPAASRFKAELRRRIHRRHEKHHGYRAAGLSFRQGPERGGAVGAQVIPEPDSAFFHLRGGASGSGLYDDA